MTTNWHAVLWHGLAAEALKAAGKGGKRKEFKARILLLAARYAAKAAGAERAERDEKSDKAK